MAARRHRGGTECLMILGRGQRWEVRPSHNVPLVQNATLPACAECKPPPKPGSFSNSNGLISGVGSADETSSIFWPASPFVAPPPLAAAATAASLRLPTVGGTAIGSGLCVGLESGVLSALLLPA
uniref:Uncharacterized protein n=1 Tax=Anopheles culicifacies TaxID=139723 RepID=A0A182LZP9_9DIPT